MELYDYSNLLTAINKINNEETEIRKQYLENLGFEFGNTYLRVKPVLEDAMNLYATFRALNRTKSFNICIDVDNCKFEWSSGCRPTIATISFCNGFHTEYASYTFYSDRMPVYYNSANENETEKIQFKIELLNAFEKCYPAVRNQILNVIYKSMGQHTENNERLRKEYSL